TRVSRRCWAMWAVSDRSAIRSNGGEIASARTTMPPASVPRASRETCASRMAAMRAPTGLPLVPCTSARAHPCRAQTRDDVHGEPRQGEREQHHEGHREPRERLPLGEVGRIAAGKDRKSTRLNSSHQIISYAVFCLKK